jgi:hypothetical protein
MKVYASLPQDFQQNVWGMWKHLFVCSYRSICLQIVFNRYVVQESDNEFKRLREELWNIRYGPYMALSKLNSYLTNSMKQSPA